MNTLSVDYHERVTDYQDGEQPPFRECGRNLSCKTEVLNLQVCEEMLMHGIHCHKMFFFY
jgi:hypothetical protein